MEWTNLDNLEKYCTWGTLIARGHEEKEVSEPVEAAVISAMDFKLPSYEWFKSEQHTGECDASGYWDSRHCCLPTQVPWSHLPVYGRQHLDFAPEVASTGRYRPDQEASGMLEVNPALGGIY
jgi:hypothetical protein